MYIMSAHEVSDFSPKKILILLLYRDFFNLFQSAEKVRGAVFPHTLKMPALCGVRRTLKSKVRLISN